MKAKRMMLNSSGSPVPRFRCTPKVAVCGGDAEGAPNLFTYTTGLIGAQKSVFATGMPGDRRGIESVRV
jgi:hypothetical protein